MPPVLPELKTHPCIKKREKPIITASDLPYPCSLVFNAGVVKYRGEYIMVFRNDYGTSRELYENEKTRSASCDTASCCFHLRLFGISRDRAAETRTRLSWSGVKGSFLPKKKNRP